MGEALYSLFGPNGQDVPVHTSERKRFNAFLELERHGLVEVKAVTADGLYNVIRQNRDLKKI